MTKYYNIQSLTAQFLIFFNRRSLNEQFLLEDFFIGFIYGDDYNHCTCTRYMAKKTPYSSMYVLDFILAE